MKKAFKIAYIAIGAAFITSLIPSLIWAGSDSTNLNEVKVEEAKLILDESARLEYIEGEKFDPTGVSISYKNKVIEAKDLNAIKYDFTTAGTNVVELINEIGNVHYRALLPVKVYHVRHLDIQNSSVSLNEDGTWDTTNLRVLAELNEPFKSFPRPDQFSQDWQKVALLNPNQYTLNMKETSFKGKYEGTIYAGKTSGTFTYYDELQFNQDRVLTLINISNTRDKLTLFVETNTNNFVWPDGMSRVEAEGTYVFTSENGEITNYRFKYYIDGWTSNFVSNSVDYRVFDKFGGALDAAGMEVTINGVTFYATAEMWHVPVLGR